MSNRLCHACRMKLKNSYWLGQTEGKTIATFGAARLVKNSAEKSRPSGAPRTITPTHANGVHVRATARFRDGARCRTSSRLRQSAIHIKLRA
jgi:hypothetical protein